MSSVERKISFYNCNLPPVINLTQETDWNTQPSFIRFFDDYLLNSDCNIGITLSQFDATMQGVSWSASDSVMTTNWVGMNKNRAVYNFTVINSSVQNVVVNVKRNCYVIHDVCRLPAFFADRTERINLLDPNGVNLVYATLVELMTSEYGIEEYFDNNALVKLDLLFIIPE